MTLLFDRSKRGVDATAIVQSSHTDERFETLMGSKAWNALADDVRRRFSNKAKGGESLVYKGVITETRMTLSGWILGQACRIIGAPLPTEAQATGTPAIVSVTEDADGHGQFWTRTYGRKKGFPQVIHSSKRFDGPTGLEEYVGLGVSMALDVTEDRAGMVFTSNGYYCHVLGARVRIPDMLMPGITQVRHDDLGDGYFAFTLSLTHRLLGEVMYQRAIFSDTGPRQRK